MGARLLLVEDDLKLATLIAGYLAQHGFEVLQEARGDRALERFRRESPDLVVLDLMLPGLDGLAVCRELRRHNAAVPLLMLTARDALADQVLGLEAGADDYVLKPVEPLLLLARLRALLRRPVAAAAGAPAPLRVLGGALRLCAARREAELDGQALALSTQEFEMLWALGRRAGQVVSRDDLLQAVRGLDFDGLDRSVDLCISRLRRKLGDCARSPVRIKTVWGRGYLLLP
ncbi:response regulator [Pelomonas sp. CA6]|uniref:response regulator n=1 Tax=Pelomonas sp. CA6 TaxID=2907999 RepID=UPI001F4BE627|nr:response regulator [Pelomonas sp. CA6]MCH7343094.1 response regulator [Pelomonas sp. CA6]